MMYRLQEVSLRLHFQNSLRIKLVTLSRWQIQNLLIPPNTYLHQISTLYLKSSPVSDIHNRWLLMILHQPVLRVKFLWVPLGQVYLGAKSIGILLHDHFLTMSREHVHSAKRTASESSGNVRRDTARRLHVSVWSPRRQCEELLAVVLSIVWLVPRVVHVYNLSLVADTLVARHFVLLDEFIVVVEVPSRILGVNFVRRRLPIALSVLALWFDLLGLRILEDLLEFWIFLTFLGLRGWNVGRWLDYSVRRHRVYRQQGVVWNRRIGN